jgi:hypothetical protein
MGAVMVGYFMYYWCVPGSRGGRGRGEVGSLSLLSPLPSAPPHIFARLAAPSALADARQAERWTMRV